MILIFIKEEEKLWENIIRINAEVKEKPVETLEIKLWLRIIF